MRKRGVPGWSWLRGFGGNSLVIRVTGSLRPTAGVAGGLNKTLKQLLWCYYRGLE